MCVLNSRNKLKVKSGSKRGDAAEKGVGTVGAPTGKLVLI